MVEFRISTCYDLSSDGSRNFLRGGGPISEFSVILADLFLLISSSLSHFFRFYPQKQEMTCFFCSTASRSVAFYPHKQVMTFFCSLACNSVIFPVLRNNVS